MMMKRIVNTNIRFDLSREDDRQAYEYLRGMDRTKFKSYTRAVVTALNDFFSRQEKMQADPFLETREKEDRFLARLLDTVKDGIRQGMSSIQLPALASAVQPEVKADDNGPAQENYDIAEAFLKDLGL
ncbi:MAG: adenylate cyclase [Clostridia bacterium]|nr:adenylate cyclase [Clostridia bacterium]